MTQTTNARSAGTRTGSVTSAPQANPNAQTIATVGASKLAKCQKRSGAGMWNLHITGLAVFAARQCSNGLVLESDILLNCMSGLSSAPLVCIQAAFALTLSLDSSYDVTRDDMAELLAFSA